MKSSLTRLWHAALGLTVAGILAFGAHTALAGAATMSICDDPGYIGDCPPYTQQTCSQACFVTYGTPGFCSTGQNPNCCVCDTTQAN